MARQKKSTPKHISPVALIASIIGALGAAAGVAWSTLRKRRTATADQTAAPAEKQSPLTTA